MTCGSCAFTTPRLDVATWSTHDAYDLPTAVASILTEPVTRSLPEAWHVAGGYSRETATAWIDARAAEGVGLLIRRRDRREVLGLMFLHETTTQEGLDVRLGYALAEHAWNQGFATEVLRGFVDWCRGQRDVHAIIAGVAESNVASIRVLTKAGFVRADETTASEHARTYWIPLRTP